MTFASLLSAEISRAKGLSPSNASGPKYLKKAELEAQREEEYLKEQERLAKEKEEKLVRKRALEGEEAEKRKERDEKRRRLAEESRARREEEEARQERAKRKRLGLPEVSKLVEGDGANGDASANGHLSESDDIAEEVLRSKLRDIQEPVTLFAESHIQRLKRYRSLVAASSTNQAVKYGGPIPTTLEPVPEANMKVPSSLPSGGAEPRKYLYRQLTSYFNMVFSEWQTSLKQRDAVVKESSQGRAAEVTMRSTLDSLRPLFQKLETDTLEDSILSPLLSIVSAAQERRYVDANDGYLRLSIGKAAWPIGVTMVGIHERSAREKLHESDVSKAHIMSDEITRKFLQGIKRCLSFAQTRWPPADFGQVMG